MTRVVMVIRGQEVDCGSYPTEQAEQFRQWVSSYAPNRHIILRCATRRSVQS